MIFGNVKSYIQNGEDIISLRWSIVSSEFLQNKDVEFESIINGNRTHDWLGDYAAFTVTDFLWKYSDPAVMFNTLKNIEHTNISFWFEGATHVSECFVSTIRPYYHKGFRPYGACVIEMYPLRYIQIGAIRVTENNEIRQTDDDYVRILEGFEI